jgi:hypothetical protein
LRALHARARLGRRLRPAVCRPRADRPWTRAASRSVAGVGQRAPRTMGPRPRPRRHRRYQVCSCGSPWFSFGCVAPSRVPGLVRSGHCAQGP